MTDTQLKPCPSCGAKNTPECTLITELYDHDKYKYGRCFNCGLKMYNWNTRPIEDELQARIAELEASLKTGWQLYEPKPYPLSVHVGDYVEHLNGKHLRVVEIKEPASLTSPHVKDRNKKFKCDNGNTYSVVDGSCICDGDTITRILKPSEVVVDFGSFKGRVKIYHGDQVRVYDENDINFACVAIAFLDTPTAAMVRELIEKQQGDAK